VQVPRYILVIAILAVKVCINDFLQGLFIYLRSQLA